MRTFQQRDVRAALAHAAEGGQALHLMDGRIAAAYGDKAPKCFRNVREFAHLFDQDAARLRATAARLGVKVVFIHHAGEAGQHVDLVGGPLERAKKAAARFAAEHQPSLF